MRIENSSIQFFSQHSIIEKRTVSETMRIWVGDRKPGPEERALVGPRDSKTVLVARSKSSPEPQLNSPDEDDPPLSPELRMIKLLIERMMGRKIRLKAVKSLEEAEKHAEKGKAVQANKTRTEPGQGFGIEYDYQESNYESEMTDFSASGVIKTTDGKQFSFNLSIYLKREFMSERNISARLGDAARLKDPLVINFGGNSAELANTRFSFDIDSDGKMDQISFVGANSGFLAIDRNEDNKINNGNELFGPKTGDGFMELTEFDSDNNNWIDENDPIYSKLCIWVKDMQGKDALLSLKQKGIGAIYLGYQATQFEINNNQNVMQGRLRASGIYANEDGSVGTIQQVDLIS